MGMMSKVPTSGLLITNIQNEIDTISKFGVENNLNLDICRDSVSALRLFEKANHDLIIIGLDDTSESAELATSLKKKFKSDTYSQIIILCEAIESKTASELVYSKIADDYVLFRPFPDLDRFQVSIERSKKELTDLTKNTTVNKFEHHFRFHAVLVEDNLAHSGYIAKLLDLINIRTNIFSSGTDFKKNIQGISPDLIILDNQLPDCYGIELIEYLSANETLKSIPVIMLTGDSRKDLVLRSIEYGVADYIIKPVQLDSFISKVKSILNFEE